MRGRRRLHHAADSFLVGCCEIPESPALLGMVPVSRLGSMEPGEKTGLRLPARAVIR